MEKLIAGLIHSIEKYFSVLSVLLFKKRGLYYLAFGKLQVNQNKAYKYIFFAYTFILIYLIVLFVVARESVYDANRLLHIFNKSESAFVLKFLLTAALGNVIIFAWIRKNKRMAEIARAFCFYSFSLQMLAFTFAGGLIGLAEENSFTADSAPFLKKLCFVAITLFAVGVMIYYFFVVPVRTIKLAVDEQKIGADKRVRLYFISYLVLIIIVTFRFTFSIQYFPSVSREKWTVKFINREKNIPLIKIDAVAPERYKVTTSLVCINENEDIVFSDLNQKTFVLKWELYRDKNNNQEIDEDEYIYNDSLTLMAQNHGVEPLVFKPNEPVHLQLSGDASEKDMREIHRILTIEGMRSLQLMLVDLDGKLHEIYYDEMKLDSTGNTSAVLP